MAQALREHRALFCIESPGTLDGGDVLRVGRRIYVGLSTRTNREAVDQLARFVTPFGYSAHAIRVRGCLHLKTAATELGDGTLLVNPDRLDASDLHDTTTIEVDPNEPGGSNILSVNGSVICADSAPRTRARLEARGYRVVSVDASELAKAEAGLTCCSLLVNDTPS